MIAPPAIPHFPSAGRACKLVRRDVKNWLCRSKANALRKKELAAKAAWPVVAEDRSDLVVSKLVRYEHAAKGKGIKPITKDAGVKPITSIYEMLETRLNSVYAARQRDAPSEQRWRFRGAWLILHLAAHACPSNPIYDIFRDKKLDETAAILEILGEVFNCAAKSGITLSPAISSVPSAPYSRPGNDHIRYDSLLSTISAHDGFSTSQLWHVIFEGASDPAKVITAAETITRHCCPMVDFEKAIKELGDPAEYYNDQDQLRIQLRDWLFLGYDELVKHRTGARLWGDAW